MATDNEQYVYIIGGENGTIAQSSVFVIDVNAIEIFEM